eukprot:TRINITY_DN48274_c0_g1_i1.p1 TRINITY_DN48274_c0_g1~~TRINITY_DN48274_c0_g1_i1.p1  ORF type:complete len:454 (-),score=86.83 TRINITY_DN48274_c0_g1_i1:37-1398(-)
MVASALAAVTQGVPARRWAALVVSSLLALRGDARQDLSQHLHGLEPQVGGDAMLDVYEKRATTRWYSCSYDWSQAKSDAHGLMTTWGYLFESIEKPLEELRHKAVDHAEEVVRQETVLNTTMALLRDAAGTLDSLKVNWYMAYGSSLGQMRSEAFIPWDLDADIIVQQADRQRLVDFVLEDAVAKVEDGIKLVAVRSDPANPRFAVLVHKYGHEVVKVLWADLATDLAIDFCFDCETVDQVSQPEGELDSAQPRETERAWFGNVEVNMLKDVFGSHMIRREHDIDVEKQAVGMPLKKEYWNCALFECKGTPPKRVEVDSVSALYRRAPETMGGPFDFRIADNSTLASSLAALRSSSKSKIQGAQEPSASLPKAARDELPKVVREVLTSLLARLRRRRLYSRVRGHAAQTEAAQEGHCSIPRDYSSCQKTEAADDDSQLLWVWPCGEGVDGAAD